MNLIAHSFTAGLLIWFALLGAIIAGRMLHGDIDSAGLLKTKHHDDDIAPERALSMTMMPVVVLSYVYTALHADMSVSHPSLPNLPDNLLMLLTGGNGLYLAGKIART